MAVVGERLSAMLTIYHGCLALMLGSAAAVFLALFFIPAPYGKFFRKGWGPVLRARWAWLIMELPSPALMIVLFLISPRPDIPRAVLLAFWLAHYLPRALLDPFRQPGRDKPFPWLLLIMALLFNIGNGFANGYACFHLQVYPGNWLASRAFITGLILFGAGYLVNRTADAKLASLRRAHPSGYQIPRGWFFDYLSCPNYFGEIIEWLGWAVMAWSPAGLVFFLFTFANLFPRAIRTHQWYQAEFPDYPPERKAVIPFVV